MGRKKHGMSGSKVYKLWCSIRHRCFNEKDKHFKDYGERGISVCDEWRNDVIVFYNYVSQLEHFGEEGYSFDRINNNGNYEPGNVRWATIKEQANNKRNNRLVNLGGKQITIAEAARELGISLGTLYSRITIGMSGERLFSKRRASAVRHDVGNGRYLTVPELVAETGLSLGTIQSRLHRGWVGVDLLKPVKK